ncbi:unnamed protein product [Prunus armeniaca]
MKSIWVGIKHGTLLATGLQAYAADPDLQQEWMMVKKVNKMRLAEYIEAMSGVKVSLDAMFDVQTKRIHKYKRQLLNILGIIHRYDCIKEYRWSCVLTIREQTGVCFLAQEEEEKGSQTQTHSAAVSIDDRQSSFVIFS